MSKEQGQQFFPPDTVLPQEITRPELPPPLTAHQEEMVLSVSAYVGFHARNLARRLGHINMAANVDDLEQSGYLGAVDAVRRFEDRGVKFESFAKRRIHGEMIQTLRDNASIPATAVRNISAIHRVEAGYIAREEPIPSNEELGAKIGLSATEVAIAKEVASITLVPLDELKANQDDEDRPDGDPISPIKTLEPEVPTIEREELITAFSAVSELERNVINLEYIGGYTREEIAEFVQLSSDEVAAVSRIAIKKMKVAVGILPESEIRVRSESTPSTRSHEPKLAMDAPPEYTRLRDFLTEIGLPYKAYREKRIGEGVDALPVGHGGLIYISPQAKETIQQRLEEQGWKRREKRVNTKLSTTTVTSLERILHAIPGFEEQIGVRAYIELLNEKRNVDDEQRDAIVAKIQVLNPIEQQVLSLRIGLEGKYMSLEQVARVLDRDLARIRQIEQKAIEKLQDSIND